MKFANINKNDNKANERLLSKNELSYLKYWDVNN